MTPQRKAEIETRLKEIDRELVDIAAGRTVNDDPARVGELLDELDAIELELGDDYSHNRQ